MILQKGVGLLVHSNGIRTALRQNLLLGIRRYRNPRQKPYHKHHCQQQYFSHPSTSEIMDISPRIRGSACTINAIFPAICTTEHSASSRLSRHTSPASWVT